MRYWLGELVIYPKLIWYWLREFVWSALVAFVRESWRTRPRLVECEACGRGTFRYGGAPDSIMTCSPECDKALYDKIGPF